MQKISQKFLIYSIWGISKNHINMKLRFILSSLKIGLYI